MCKIDSGLSVPIPTLPDELTNNFTLSTGVPALVNPNCISSWSACIKALASDDEFFKISLGEALIRSIVVESLTTES